MEHDGILLPSLKLVDRVGLDTRRQAPPQLLRMIPVGRDDADLLRLRMLPLDPVARSVDLALVVDPAVFEAVVVRTVKG